MLIELRQDMPITVPKEMLDTLELAEGDALEVQVKYGGIFLEPVAVYPKECIERLLDEAKEVRQQLEAYDSAEEIAA